MANGRRPAGEIPYQANRTKDGHVVMLMNNRGVARVDRSPRPGRTACASAPATCR